MNLIDRLLENSDRASMILLGYRSIHEQIKNKIISELPHITLIDAKNLTSNIRDTKINSLLNNINYDIRYIVIDIGDIYPETKGKQLLPRSQLIFRTISVLRSQCVDKNYSLIVTAPAYFQLEGDFSISGGGQLMYSADIALIINDEMSVNIMKNRFINATNERKLPIYA